MAKRVIYIPRPRVDAEKLDSGKKPSLLTQAEKWKNKLEKGHDFSLVCVGELLTGDPAEGGEKNTIYIYGGHGLPGIDGAGWPGNPGTPGSVVVNAAQVALRISAAGWSPALFRGRVKVYSCYSGEPGSNVAFASLVAGEMRNKGWTNCTFYGYLTEIGQVHEKITNIMARAMAGTMARRNPQLDEGKLVDDLVGQVHKWAVVEKQKIGRVRDQRVTF
jgi:hypothetical protein